MCTLSESLFRKLYFHLGQLSLVEQAADADDGEEVEEEKAEEEEEKEVKAWIVKNDCEEGLQVRILKHINRDKLELQKLTIHSITLAHLLNC